MALRKWPLRDLLSHLLEVPSVLCISLPHRVEFYIREAFLSCKEYACVMCTADLLVWGRGSAYLYLLVHYAVSFGVNCLNSGNARRCIFEHKWVAPTCMVFL